jgi:hypothetical protein
VVSLDFSVTYSFRLYHGPRVDSAPSENEYQEHFLGVKAAGAWSWQPHHLHVPNVMKSGNLNLPEASGPHRACYGTALRLILEDMWSKFCTYFSSSQRINTGLHSLQEHIITTVTAEDDLLECRGGGAELSLVFFGQHDSSSLTWCDRISG